MTSADSKKIQHIFKKQKTYKTLNLVVTNISP